MVTCPYCRHVFWTYFPVLTGKGNVCFPDFNTQNANIFMACAVKSCQMCLPSLCKYFPSGNKKRNFCWCLLFQQVEWLEEEHNSFVKSDAVWHFDMHRFYTKLCRLHTKDNAVWEIWGSSNTANCRTTKHRSKMGLCRNCCWLVRKLTILPDKKGQKTLYIPELTNNVLP